MNKYRWYGQGLLNSYAQVFFSDHKWFGAILLAITFMDFYAGLFGLLAVLAANTTAALIGFGEYKIQQGYYGFNALLVGLGLGIHFQPGPLLVFIVLVAGLLTLFIAVALEGVIGKYALPYLSIPFVLALWVLMLASREFSALGLNERGIYTLNDLYILGGYNLVKLYEWWNALPLPSSLRAYFLSLGAIFFQYSVLSGILVALGLLLYSRIAFTLSLLGFYAAYAFYGFIGAEITETGYSYIGFNYILTAIAIGGFFIIPNWSAYLWAALIVPIVAVLTIGLAAVFAVFYLPIYSLPFNIATLTFLYVLKFRIDNRAMLSTLFVQHNSPERNLYAFANYMERFGKESPVPLSLPFFGEWTVTQGHDGPYTHQGEWRHAWDFEIKDESGKTYQGAGDYPVDYYCYDKALLAPADGIIEEVVDEIEDNIIGERNLEYNWGNTVVIRHAEGLYSKLSHLKKGATVVKSGDKVKQGDLLGKCGNSGNSPYPHLHFQVQATPYIGSKTIEYPLSNVFIRQGDQEKLRSVAIPAEGEAVSTLPIHPALKKAFHFIPGRKIKFQVEGGERPEVSWEIQRDYYLNSYIGCGASHSKAYFKSDGAMLHFTHFEGDRNSLLYLFYLAAYKVSFGFNHGLVLQDSLPINMVYPPNRIVLQDFVAPFYRYLSGEYTLAYPASGNKLLNRELRLQGTVAKKSFRRVQAQMEFAFEIDGRGLRAFHVQSRRFKIKALCIDN